VIIILADGALDDGGDAVPLVANLADSQLFLELSIIKADFSLVLLDYVMELGQNDAG
jgi:hypothetical protein